VYCTTGRWPTDAATLGTTAGVGVTLDGSGYEVTTPVAPPAPDAPAYTLTSYPNLILDPSFESPATAAGWNISAGATVTTAQDPLYGSAAAHLAIPAHGFLDQYVLYTFERSTDFGVAIWARSANGRAQSVALELDAWLTGGARIPSLARVDRTLPADGSWVQLAAHFRTPAAGRIWVMRYLLVPSASSSALSLDVDGASLQRGPLPASFPYLRHVDPSTLPSALPSFWSSPVIGVGPISSLEFGSIDNEYALFVLSFGVVGLAAYLLLYLTVGMTALRGWLRRRTGPDGALALALGLATLATLAYGIAAGAYYSYQAMAVLWLWVGWVSAAGRVPAGAIRSPDASGVEG
jgi:hypothetical protein